MIALLYQFAGSSVAQLLSTNQRRAMAGQSTQRSVSQSETETGIETHTNVRLCLLFMLVRATFCLCSLTLHVSGVWGVVFVSFMFLLLFCPENMIATLAAVILVAAACRTCDRSQYPGNVGI